MNPPVLKHTYKITADMIDMLFWFQRKGVLIDRFSKLHILQINIYSSTFARGLDWSPLLDLWITLFVEAPKKLAPFCLCNFRY